MLVFHDPRADWHDTGPGHPERIARLKPVLRAVDRLGLERVTPRESRTYAPKWADRDAILKNVRYVHSKDYLRRLENAVKRDRPSIDSNDSTICIRSFDAALASVGCALAAAESVITGEAQRAFSAMRPPGHHCEFNHSMGFCLINNIAVAAEYLIHEHDVDRIAIIDFDVHHGNATQHSFEDRGEVYYISSHQHPATLFPGTGYEHELGARGTPGEGRTLNIPMAPFTDGETALGLYEQRVLAALDEYKPEVIMISAGFDCDIRDPLASIRWTPETFGRITEMLVEAADKHAQGRVISVLEGGYDLEALDDGAEAFLRSLAGG